jgi:hypothetical protein
MADLATQYPSSPSFQSVNFKLVTPSQVTETNSGKVRRTGYGVSYYTWEVQYPTLTPLQAGTVTGYLAQTFGPQLSFEIILPEISYTKLTNQTTNTCTVGSTNSGIGATNTVGAKVVQLTGCGTSKTVLAAGDFFKFSNHSKVYMCVSPCTADSSGNATLYFSGSLTNTIVNGTTTLTITAVPFTAILNEDVQEWSVGYGGLTTLKVGMRENW